MAGSASTRTYVDHIDGNGVAGRIRQYVIAWTSDDTTGAVSHTTDKIVGRLLRVVTNPGAPAPDANYDITIKDENAFDVLASIGGTGGTAPTLANRHTTTTEEVHLWAEDSVTNPLPGTEPRVCGVLTVAVTNAGNSKQGQITIYYSP